VANIDTLYVHLNIEDYERQVMPFLENIIQAENKDPYKEVESSYQGVTYYTHPERTKGNWHAVCIWHYEPESPQGIAFRWRFNEKRSTKESTWPIELALGSTACWSMPFPDLWEIAINTLKKLVVHGEVLAEEKAIQSRISRVDIAIDTDLFSFQPHHRDRFLSRSRHRGDYTGETERVSSEEVSEFGYTAVYHQARTFTGFAFGKGDLVARVYNKYFEICHARSYKEDKSFMQSIWSRYGWKQDRDVWRIEFQLRREALRGFPLPHHENKTFAQASVPEAMKYIHSLLPYLLTQWLTYRIPSKNKNRSEWKIHPNWLRLAEESIQQFGMHQRIKLAPQFDMDELAKSLKGYLVAYAVALQEPSIENLVHHLLTLLGQTFRNQKDIVAFLNQEIQAKARIHGIRLPESVQRGCNE
jgi:hypothetical protein